MGDASQSKEGGGGDRGVGGSIEREPIVTGTVVGSLLLYDLYRGEEVLLSADPTV